MGTKGVRGILQDEGSGSDHPVRSAMTPSLGPDEGHGPVVGGCEVGQRHLPRRPAI